MIDMQTPEAFVSALANYQGENIFNPYHDVCPVYDKKNANFIRQKNLIAILRSAQKQGVHSIWIGRDLGYRGGRRTGIALTDEVHLQDAARRFGLHELEQPTIGPPIKERTSKVIWDELAFIQEGIMFWNVFPFHPHPADETFANRAHTQTEQLSAKCFLSCLVTMLRPSRLVAIGRDAERAVSSFGLQVSHVRHPSYGGQREFITGIQSLYGVKRSYAPAEQLALL